MRKGRFTKGPWKVNKCANFIAVDPVCGQINGIFQETIDLRRPEHRKALANAHLIAAAPDMYECLEKLLDICENGIHFEVSQLTWLLQDVAAATRKARGTK